MPPKVVFTFASLGLGALLYQCVLSYSSHERVVETQAAVISMRDKIQHTPNNVSKHGVTWTLEDGKLYVFEMYQTADQADSEFLDLFDSKLQERLEKYPARKEMK